MFWVEGEGIAGALYVMSDGDYKVFGDISGNTITYEFGGGEIMMGYSGWTAAGTNEQPWGLIESL